MTALTRYVTPHTPRELIHQAVRCVSTARDMRWVARVNSEPLDHARHAQFLRWAALKRKRATEAVAAYVKAADGPDFSIVERIV